MATTVARRYARTNCASIWALVGSELRHAWNVIGIRLTTPLSARNPIRNGSTIAEIFQLSTLVLLVTKPRARVIRISAVSKVALTSVPIDTDGTRIAEKHMTKKAVMMTKTEMGIANGISESTGKMAIYACRAARE